VSHSAQLYQETSETLGTVETLFTPKNDQKAPENAIIRSKKSPKNTFFSPFSTQKYLKNTHFHQKTLKKTSFFIK
jgi:hypothetical protein